MIDPAMLTLAAQGQSQITSAALIDRARQDFGSLIQGFDAPAKLKDDFSRQGAQQALMEAYVTLAGESLVGTSDAELEATIRDRVQLLASGIRIFARQAAHG
jgi:hypothetical protein